MMQYIPTLPGFIRSCVDVPENICILLESLGCLCCVSEMKIFYPNESVEGQGASVANLARLLRLDRIALNTFYEKFCEAARDGKSRVAAEAIIRRTGRSPSTPVLCSYFNRFDESSSKSGLDFGQYLASCYTLLAASDRDIRTIIFRLLDKEGRGCIKSTSSAEVLQFVWGNHASLNGEKLDRLKEVCAFDEGSLSFGKFHSLASQYKAFIEPMLTLQENMRESFPFEEGFWHRLQSQKDDTFATLWRNYLSAEGLIEDGDGDTVCVAGGCVGDQCTISRYAIPEDAMGECAGHHIDKIDSFRPAQVAKKEVAEMDSLLHRLLWYKGYDERLKEHRSFTWALQSTYVPSPPRLPVVVSETAASEVNGVRREILEGDCSVNVEARQVRRARRFTENYNSEYTAALQRITAIRRHQVRVSETFDYVANLQKEVSVKKIRDHERYAKQNLILRQRHEEARKKKRAIKEHQRLRDLGILAKRRHSESSISSIASLSTVQSAQLKLPQGWVRPSLEGGQRREQSFQRLKSEMRGTTGAAKGDRPSAAHRRYDKNKMKEIRKLALRKQQLEEAGQHRVVFL